MPVEMPLIRSCGSRLSIDYAIMASDGAKLLPQSGLVHLAGRVARQRLDKSDRARVLVACKVRFTVRKDLHLGQSLTGPQRDDCTANLAPSFIRHADHRHLGNR